MRLLVGLSLLVALLMTAHSARAAVVLTSRPTVATYYPSVTISWTTSVSATTEVYWGPTSEPLPLSNYTGAGSGSSTSPVAAASAGTVHSRTMNYLAPGTYYFRVQSTDASNNHAISAEQTFTVAPPTDGQVIGHWLPDGPVTDQVVGNGKLYTAGQFPGVYERTGEGGVFNGSTGAADDASQPLVDGAVKAVIPDGSGGWYIGGRFDHVGGVASSGIAHILPDDGVDPAWTSVAAANSTGSVLVHDLTLSGTTLYLGGDFTSLGATGRVGLAAIDVTTPSAPVVTAFSADTYQKPGAVYIAGGIEVLRVAAGYLYFGGQFDKVENNTSVANFARVSLTGPGYALDTGFQPVNGIAYAAVVSGTNIYVGGSFSTPHPMAAAFNTTSGATQAWNPGMGGGSVYTMTLNGANIYLGGSFNQCVSTPRTNACAITTGGALNGTWIPSPNGQVSQLYANGANIYMAGLFDTVDGSNTHVGAAETIDGNSNANVTFVPALHTKEGDVIAFGAGQAYVGGNFSGWGVDTARNDIFATDLSTGTLSTFAPPAFSANPYIWAMAYDASDNVLFAAGQFTTVASVNHNNAVALDPNNGPVAAGWTHANFPDFTGTAVPRIQQIIDVGGGRVLFGGSFTGITNSTGAALLSAAPVPFTGLRSPGTADDRRCPGGTRRLRGRRSFAGDAGRSACSPGVAASDCGTFPAPDSDRKSGTPAPGDRSFPSCGRNEGRARGQRTTGPRRAGAGAGHQRGDTSPHGARRPLILSVGCLVEVLHGNACR